MNVRNGMRPVHPGEVLRDELEEIGLSANALSKSLGVPVNRVTMILKGQRGVSADTALRLARYFGTTPQLWMNLQKTWELRQAEIVSGSTIDEDVMPRQSEAYEVALARDTIYKKSELPILGNSLLRRIDKILWKEMYERHRPPTSTFQSITSYVELLKTTQSVHDIESYSHIVEAKDNNKRYVDLIVLRDFLLPSINKIDQVFPQIRDTLKQAWLQTEQTHTVSSKGTVDSVRGMESHQVTEEIASIITQYRYFEPGATYRLIRDIYVASSNSESRKQLVRIAEKLAKNNRQIWEKFGPAVQVILAERLSRETDIREFAPLALTVTQKILEPDIEGMELSTDSMSVYQGMIAYTPALASARRGAIDTILTYVESIVNEEVLFRDAVECLFVAGRVPRQSAISPSLLAMIYSDITYVISRITTFVGALKLHLKQILELALFRQWRNLETLPQEVETDSVAVNAHNQFLKALDQFQEKLNADETYVALKSIVGYQSFFPHYVKGPDKFEDRIQDGPHIVQEKVAASITEKNWPQWKARLSIFAKARTRDLTPNTPYMQFLSVLADRNKNLVFDLFTDRDQMPTWTIRPIAKILLDRHSQPEVNTVLSRWLDSDEYLEDIAALIVDSNYIDATIVQRAVDLARDQNNQEACLLLMEASIRHFDHAFTFWRDEVFTPLLDVLEPARVSQLILKLGYTLDGATLFEELNSSIVEMPL